MMEGTYRNVASIETLRSQKAIQNPMLNKTLAMSGKNPSSNRGVASRQTKAIAKDNVKAGRTHEADSADDPSLPLSSDVDDPSFTARAVTLPAKKSMM
jgi:hypothetical protein